MKQGIQTGCNALDIQQHSTWGWEKGFMIAAMILLYLVLHDSHMSNSTLHHVHTGVILSITRSLIHPQSIKPHQSVQCLLLNDRVHGIQLTKFNIFSLSVTYKVKNNWLNENRYDLCISTLLII